VLLVVGALRLLDIGEGGVGWLNACWGIGGVLGGAAALGLLGRGRLGALAGIGAHARSAVAAEAVVTDRLDAERVG
jgi:hypothetical protein